VLAYRVAGSRGGARDGACRPRREALGDPAAATWKPKAVCLERAEETWCAGMKAHKKRNRTGQRRGAHLCIGGSRPGVGSVSAATAPYPGLLCEDAAPFFAAAIAMRFRSLCTHTIQR
jgi:hypothetical protein